MRNLRVEVTPRTTYDLTIVDTDTNTVIYTSTGHSEQFCKEHGAAMADILKDRPRDPRFENSAYGAWLRGER